MILMATPLLAHHSKIMRILHRANRAAVRVLERETLEREADPNDPWFAPSLDPLEMAASAPTTSPSETLASAPAPNGHALQVGTSRDP